MTHTRILFALGMVGAGVIGSLTAPMLAGADNRPTASYNAFDPQRILDTRNSEDEYWRPKAGGGEFTLYGGAGTTGLAAHITVINPDADGYVTVYPRSAKRPNTSTLNFRAGEVTNDFTIIPTDSNDGGFTVYVSAGADVTIDHVGSFTVLGD